MEVVENDELDSWIQNVVAERVADANQISGIRRTRLPHIGSYECEQVTIELRDGARIALFLKDYARSRLSKDHPGRRRLRELRVYEELLSDVELGTPRFYGSMWDEGAGKYRILIESIDAEIVKNIDERNGIPAVEWLARMQRYFLDRTEQLAECGFLIEHDMSYYDSRAASAYRDVWDGAPSCAHTLRHALDCYRRNVDSMISQPRCLVHGGYIPWHIIVDRHVEPPRVCVVDWELAARGGTLFDLATFIDDGAGPLRDKLCAAYRDAANSYGVPVLPEAQMKHTIECFRLHRVVDWLSRSAEKGFSSKKISWLVSRAEAIAGSIDRGA